MAASTCTEGSSNLLQVQPDSWREFRKAILSDIFTQCQETGCDQQSYQGDRGLCIPLLCPWVSLLAFPIICLELVGQNSTQYLYQLWNVNCLSEEFGCIF